MPDQSHSTKSPKTPEHARHRALLLNQLSILAARHDWEDINPGAYSRLAVNLTDYGLDALRHACIDFGVDLDLIRRITGEPVVSR